MTILWLLPLLLLNVRPMESKLQMEPKLHTEAIDYNEGNVALQGYLAYDETIKGKRPGVLIVHEWRGHGEYVRRRAEEIAKLGYTAFAVDMYGKGVFAKDHTEAGKLSGVFFQDRARMRTRVAAGLEVLKKQETCDVSKMAAMGYCFGGTTVLEMARAGMEVKGVASFHGNLSAPEPAKPDSVKAKVIVFHGADDRFIAPEQISGFVEEMRKVHADWQLITFGGAVHSFTVKEAGSDLSTGMAYNENADRRSWEMLKLFLAEVFK